MMNGQKVVYPTYLITASGERIPLEANSLVIELAPGRELELDLVAYPNHEGQLTIRAGSELDAGNHGGQLSLLVVRPGASNLVHIGVERLPWQDSAPES
ncbi:MAG: hypothetical protein QMB70_06805 [Aeromonadaceae bacterium]